MTKKPYKPTPGKSLADLDPTVARQWDSNRNGSLTPADVRPGSDIKVWWKCEHGHAWQAIVRSRLRSQKCPYCIGRHVSPEKSLAVTHPEIASEWHPTKNKGLSPAEVTFGQSKSVWWQCGTGHAWQARISNRARGNACPYCSGRLVAGHNSLAALYPEVSAQWHPVKNGELTPDHVAVKSNKRAWWKCAQGHEWQTAVSNRSNGTECPKCVDQRRKKPRVPLVGESLEHQNPAVAAQWHPSKNGALTPARVFPGSKERYWWLCNKGHEWRTSVTARSRGSGCPYCARRIVRRGQSLLVKEPNVARQWHPSKNETLSPEEVSPGSGQVVWWLCEKGHEWKQRINKRVKGRGCPHCPRRRVPPINNLAAMNPEIASQWHPTRNEDLTPKDVTANSNKKVWWRCSFQHEWAATVYNRNQGSGCPLCAGQTSRPEIRIYSELVGIFGEVSRRQKIFKDEIDVYIPRYKVGIEYDGVYYHATKVQKDQNKNKRMNANGVELIRVREKPLSKISEWDVICPPGSLRKQSVDEVLSAIRDRCDKPDIRKIDRYLTAAKFQSGAFYRKILSYLPAPPPDESFESLFPEFAKLWHKEKNFPLTPNQFLPKSQKKVWWLCSKGHEWNSRIADLTGSKGCPFCMGRRVGDDNNVAILRPDIAREWHPVKNGSKYPSEFTVGSRERIWWLCRKGHEWPAAIVSRTNGQGCPYCAGRLASGANNLAVLNPQLAAQWHESRNGALTPSEVTQFSNKKVWWRCDRDHEWCVSVASRSGGSGCPYCSGNKVGSDNNLAVINPGLATEWHPTKNGSFTPAQVTPGSTRKAWWRCAQGHEWKATIYDRHYGSGCPYCSGNRAGSDNNLAVKHPAIAEQWHKSKNAPLSATQFTPGSGKKVWWECSRGHEWQATIASRVRGSGCPHCRRSAAVHSL